MSSALAGGRAMTRTGEIRDQSFTSPLWQLLRNVVNHSSYRQVATMLRQLGASAPATDLVVYHRTVAPPLATS